MILICYEGMQRTQDRELDMGVLHSDGVWE
jgi:hypothetical protein